MELYLRMKQQKQGNAVLVIDKRNPNIAGNVFTEDVEGYPCA